MGNMRTRLPTPPCGQHVISKLQEDFNIEGCVPEGDERAGPGLELVYLSLPCLHEQDQRHSRIRL